MVHLGLCELALSWGGHLMGYFVLLSGAVFLLYPESLFIFIFGQSNGSCWRRQTPYGLFTVLSVLGHSNLLGLLAVSY